MSEDAYPVIHERQKKMNDAFAEEVARMERGEITSEDIMEQEKAQTKQAENFLMTDEERYQAEMNVLVQELSGMLGHLSADALAKAYAAADQRISHIRQGQIEELRGLLARTKSGLAPILNGMQDIVRGTSAEPLDLEQLKTDFYLPLVDISVRLNP